MSQANYTSREQAAITMIKAKNGRIRMAEAIANGINRRTLYGAILQCFVSALRENQRQASVNYAFPAEECKKRLFAPFPNRASIGVDDLSLRRISMVNANNKLIG
jgi:hypothetical protein